MVMNKIYISIFYIYSWICTKPWKTTEKTDNWLWGSYYLFFKRRSTGSKQKIYLLWSLSPLKLTSILFVLPIPSCCISKTLTRLQERYKPKSSQDGGCQWGSKSYWLTCREIRTRHCREQWDGEKKKSLFFFFFFHTHTVFYFYKR